MTEVHLERERKFDVDEDVEVPPLTELLGSHRTQLPHLVDGEAEEHRLEATYLDTPDLRLAAAGLTLRRRTGGHDAGWHLKVPATGGARSEVREPLGDEADTADGTDRADQVPDALRRMVRAVARGEDLVPVARIRTVRTERRLVDPTGQVLAELAEDRVSAVRLPTPGGRPGPVGSDWREVEVELVGGDEALLDALDAGLQSRGLRPAGHGSKLLRVLGEPPSDGSDPGTREASGVQVLLAHVAGQVRQVRSQDLPVRLDAPDSIHAMRVACRRLRSALSTFGPLFDADAVRPLREELRWLAGELGAARDAEVMRDRLQQAVEAEQPLEPDGAPAAGAADPQAAVAADAAEQLDGTYRAAHSRVLEVLDGERYHRLLEALDAFLQAPPSTGEATGRARDVLPGLVRRRYRRLRRLVEAAREEPAGQRREDMLHEARKAAKRARYAAESVRPVFGGPAGRFAAAMEEVQEVLGEHQDSVVTRQRLRDLAASTSSTEAAFGYGRLYALEEAHGAAAEQRLDTAWARARRRSLRRWLR